MQKLSLTLDALRVESFDAGAASGQHGTVRAYSTTDVTQVLTGGCCTALPRCNPDVTRVHTGACCPPA